MSDDAYGPCLPPGFSKSNKAEDKIEIGPVLPPHLSGTRKEEECSESQDYIGPVLPPNFHKNSADKISDCVIKQNKKNIGPALPPGFGSDKGDNSCKSDSEEDSVTVGPSLPKSLQKKLNSSSKTIGPAMPPGLLGSETGKYSSDSESDEDIIGPLPSMMADSNTSYSTSAEFEERAKKMKDRLEGKEMKEEKIERESWMTELPSTKLGQSIGLSARTFRARAGPDLSDQSVWTDTPADREKKLQSKHAETSLKRSAEELYKSERDEKLKTDIDSYNKSKRGESLMDMHQKKLKKAKESEEDQPQVRRPFDREVDLQVNRFDDAQRKSMIKKAQKLDSRFGHGSTQFL